MSFSGSIRLAPGSLNMPTNENRRIFRFEIDRHGVPRGTGLAPQFQLSQSLDEATLDHLFRPRCLLHVTWQVTDPNLPLWTNCNSLPDLQVSDPLRQCLAWSIPKANLKRVNRLQEPATFGGGSFQKWRVQYVQGKAQFPDFVPFPLPLWLLRLHRHRWRLCSGCHRGMPRIRLISTTSGSPHQLLAENFDSTRSRQDRLPEMCRLSVALHAVNLV